MKIHKKCTVEPYSFLVTDTILPTDDLELQKIFLKEY